MVTKPATANNSYLLRPCHAVTMTLRQLFLCPKWARRIWAMPWCSMWLLPRPPCMDYGSTFAYGVQKMAALVSSTQSGRCTTLHSAMGRWLSYRRHDWDCFYLPCICTSEPWKKLTRFCLFGSRRKVEGRGGGIIAGLGKLAQEEGHEWMIGCACTTRAVQRWV